MLERVTGSEVGSGHDVQADDRTRRDAPAPTRGFYAEGFEPVARVFAAQLATSEIGASFAVFHRGHPVVDLWGGLANVERRTPWQRDTRVTVFSVTKGFTAMAMHLLAERGGFDWDAPVAEYWPGFGKGGKSDVSVRTLLNHRAGLPFLDAPLKLADCLRADRRGMVLDALERQRPAWTPDTRQGYHAVTYGLYARELFERIAKVDIGRFLREELFEPVGSDAHLGTPAHEDARVATHYTIGPAERIARVLHAVAFRPESPEARIARDLVRRESIVRKTMGTARPDVRRGLGQYNEATTRRTALAWASATASARGIARAYLPFAQGGAYGGRRFFSDRSLEPIFERQSWSTRDAVLNKPLGWSQGFLKEDGVFGPSRSSFGHAGLGGSLGWCDPSREVAFGYATNNLDWRVRSPRAIALCRALFSCGPLAAG